jgi:homoserine dehydrogenase
MPRFISKDKYLYGVDHEYNGVIAEAAFADRQFFYGKGAGGHASGCAVLSDISANSYNYRYEYKKRKQKAVSRYTRDISLEVYFRYQDDKDRKMLCFKDIKESYVSKDYKFLIGTVNLERLYEIRKVLPSMNGFIVAI